MRGNINWQVQEIFHKSGINCIGESKHAAKEEARELLQTENRPGNWHSVGKKMGIHSYATADTYRDVWKHLGRYVKSEFNLKDLERLTGEHVQSYLEHRIVTDIAHSTFQREASALEKLETALNGYAAQQETGRTYAFSEFIANVRADAHQMLQRFDGSRAYQAPEHLIENLQGEQYRLVAQMQLEGGLRISECNHITEKHLRGMVRDSATGEPKGCVYVQGKGGIRGEKLFSPGTYQQLEQVVQGSPNGRFEFSKNDYRSALKVASEKTGQPYNGSHGLRWNFARERFQEVQQYGQSYEQALAQVSNELFHQRADITEHYLR